MPNEMLAVVVPHYGQPTETFIRRYCLELCPERTVLVHFYPGASQWQINGAVYSLPQATFGSVPVWKAFRGFQKLCRVERLFGDPYTSHSLASFFRRHKVACVFSQYLIAGWNVDQVVKSMGLRHVIRGHGFDVSAALADPEWCRRYRELSDADAIVVPSPYQVERLQRIGLNNPGLMSVPYGVDLPASLLSRPAVVQTGPRVVRVVAVGRMVAKKAPLAAVQAFLLAAKSNPELQFTFIGTGPLESSVRDYVKQHDPSGRIQLVGARSHGEVLQAMNEADIFLQHSITDPKTGDQEGAPVAILEAMAHGLPVVSTLHSGIPYLVEHGVTGLLTNEGDVQAMAASIVQLARSADLRRIMGLAGSKRAENFSWERERETLIKLLFP
jgi:colanic acid/amylovoran biosynthesis glycosyltransferase